MRKRMCIFEGPLVQIADLDAGAEVLIFLPNKHQWWCILTGRFPDYLFFLRHIEYLAQLVVLTWRYSAVWKPELPAVRQVYAVHKAFYLPTIEMVLFWYTTTTTIPHRGVNCFRIRHVIHLGVWPVLPPNTGRLVSVRLRFGKTTSRAIWSGVTRVKEGETEFLRHSVWDGVMACVITYPTTCFSGTPRMKGTLKPSTSCGVR